MILNSDARQLAGGNFRLEKVMNKERTKMKTLITRLGPVYMRENPDHKGYWDVLETRSGKVTGKSTYTGTLAEVRQSIRLGLLQLNA